MAEEATFECRADRVARHKVNFLDKAWFVVIAMAGIAAVSPICPRAAQTSMRSSRRSLQLM